MLLWVAQGRNVPRGNDPATYNTNGGTVYAPNHATCVADDSLKTPFRGTGPITVRPDCDGAISRVCTVVAAQYAKGNQMNNIRAKSDGNGSCEATILFSQPKLADPVDYDQCVSVFQWITVGCMLPQRGSSGTPGAQGGVVNVEYTAEGGPDNTTYPLMKASDHFNYGPGYMVGPPGYFGGYSYGEDVSGLYHGRK